MVSRYLALAADCSRSRRACSADLGALYPMLQPGRSGLARTSYALIDRLRSVDKRRIRRVFGVVSTSEVDALDEGLVLFLGPGAKLTSSAAEPVEETKRSAPS